MVAKGWWQVEWKARGRRHGRNSRRCSTRGRWGAKSGCVAFNRRNYSFDNRNYGHLGRRHLHWALLLCCTSLWHYTSTWHCTSAWH